MSKKYELTKAFRRNDLIPKCIYPDCNMVRIGGEWVDCRKNNYRNYRNYTGSLCDEHFELVMKNRLEKKLKNEKNS